jgi:hypothetical protein
MRKNNNRKEQRDMATFMEAMQAAREGRRVRFAVNTGHGRWVKRHHLDTNGLVWDMGGNGYDYILLTLDLLDKTWEIEQPPPKRYSFLEAVALMEQHKVSRIRSVLSGHQFHLVSYNSLLFSHGAQRGPTIQEIQGQWEEVQ